MSDTVTFNGITPEIFSCLKSKSQEQRGTLHEPADANTGTATTKVPVVGSVVIGFTFDPDASTLTYTIVQKPRMIPTDQLWNGIASVIKECGGTGE